MTTDHDTHLEIGYEDEPKQRPERDPEQVFAEWQELCDVLWPEQTEYERRTTDK